MRLRAISFAALAAGAVAAAAWQGGIAATAHVERRTEAELRAVLAGAGQDWARIAADGLIVTLSGAAPDESAHLHAVEALHQRVGMRRLEDRTTLRPAAPGPAPDFAVELLRNHGAVSLIGSAPDPDSRNRIRAALIAADLGAEMSDMLESGAHAPPPGWEASLGFGLELIAAMPRARIGIAPGEVTVSAVLGTDSERVAMAAALGAAAPDGVAVRIDLTAPRPVIAPFRLEFAITGGAAVLAACAAESEPQAAGILAAARAAGLAGAADCTLGLGAPSADWPVAAAQGIAALAELGDGRFTLVDAQAQLTAPAGVTAAALDAATARLGAALPAGYALTVVVAGDGPGAEGRVHAPRFDAVLGSDGILSLDGAVHDAVAQAAIESYAAKLFGHGRVLSATVVDPRLPESWPLRVLAGIEALAEVTEGRLEVTPAAIALSGRSVEADADARVEALLAAKALGPAQVEVRYDAAGAAAAAAAARPAPERCAGEIGAILEVEAIVFRPGSAEIDPVSGGVIAAIADVLRECPGAEFEVAGHTDASGRAEANQELSEARALAVVAALRAQDLPLIGLEARGYGSAHPRAGNDTAEGRARNRRIELTLIDPEARAAEAEAEAAEVAGEALPLPGDAAACGAEVARILATEPVEFELGSARISEASADVIEALIAALRGCGEGHAFEIAGHTDDRGPAEVNQRLSEERAGAVRDAIAGAEIPGITLAARGYGPEQPIADNDSAEGRARNRRIEITPVAADAAEPEAEAEAPEAEVDEAEAPEAGDTAEPEADETAEPEAADGIAPEAAETDEPEAGDGSR